MKTILKYVKIFFLLIAFFFIFSILSCLIPYEFVRKNIKKSIPELMEEQNYPKTILKGSKYQQDNFTDALILDVIVSADPKRPVKSVLTNPFSFESPEKLQISVVSHLKYKVEHIELAPNMTYNRYWFGSATICKILLIFMTYQQIKWFLYFVSTILLFIFVVSIVNNTGWIKSLPIFLSLLFANLFVMQFSLQFFPVISIALIGGIWMSKNKPKPLKSKTLCLFILGIFTAYFDLLTAPLLTLGIPLIVYMILHGGENIPAKVFYKSIIILCFAWFIGYACAWAIKWVLVVIFADSSALYGTFQTIKSRTTTGDYTRWDAIVRNFKLLPLVWINITLTPLLMLTFFSFNKKGIKSGIAFLFVGLLPYIWYFVLSSHSHPHWWFTYRAQIISMSCSMLIFISLIDWERLKIKLKLKQ